MLIKIENQTTGDQYIQPVIYVKNPAGDVLKYYPFRLLDPNSYIKTQCTYWTTTPEAQNVQVSTPEQYLVTYTGDDGSTTIVKSDDSTSSYSPLQCDGYSLIPYYSATPSLVSIIGADITWSEFAGADESGESAEVLKDGLTFSAYTLISTVHQSVTIPHEKCMKIISSSSSEAGVRLNSEIIQCVPDITGGGKGLSDVRNTIYTSDPDGLTGKKKLMNALDALGLDIQLGTKIDCNIIDVFKVLTNSDREGYTIRLGDADAKQ
ncbi:MAG: hypothetical protein LBB34_01080 [Holosporales bacterium]|jgi:hypothetical protein|nr:hypothetical protein [Holosporales bacterium]